MNDQQDVIVIGGGIIGIACAHYLAEAGQQVTIIERGKMAASCSHANCGYISPCHILPLTEPGAISIAFKSMFNSRSPFRVKPSFDVGLWHWFYQFARRCTMKQALQAGAGLHTILEASMREYHTLVKNPTIDCEWQEKGLMYAFRSEGAFEKFARNDRLLTEHFGLAAQRISGDELERMQIGFRPGLHGAFMYPDDTTVRPDLLNRSWVELLKERGVRIVEACELKDVHFRGDDIASLHTSSGSWSAKRYVFAMGALSGQWGKRLRCTLPVRPGKGYSVTLPKPPNCPTYPVLFPEAKVGVSPFEHGMRLGSMMEFVGYDSSIPEYRIQQLRDAGRQFLLADVDGIAEEKWYGWRPMTWDSLPIIGAMPGSRNGLLATGHNMLGLTLAPATGRLIADLVTEREPFINPTPYSPTRF